MGLQTINTIQSGINSNYSDRYIKQALANLGQRTGAKGDSIINSSFTLKELLNSTSTNNIVAYYKADNNIILRDTIDENISIELSYVNTIYNISFNLLEYIPSQQFNGTITKLVDTKIIKNTDSYFFISKCINKENLLDSIVCFEFAELSEQLINGVIIVPKAGYIDYYKVITNNNELEIVDDAINSIQLINFSIDDIYDSLLFENTVDNVIDTLITGIQFETKRILNDDEKEPYINKLKYYTLNYPKYIKTEFNNALYFVNDSYIGLKKSILYKFIDEVYKNSGYKSSNEFIMYFPSNTEIQYIINENTHAIYFSYDIPVYYSNELKQSSLNNNFISLNNLNEDEKYKHIVASIHSEDKISMFRFLVTYINDDKYIDNIIVSKVQTLPYITTNKQEENVWVLNDVETSIPATGEDAGNPNIMMLSFTKQDNNSNVQVLHTYNDHEFKEKIEGFYEDYNANNGSLVDAEFEYDSDLFVNVDNQQSFKFKIKLPNINKILELNKHYGKIIKNTLLWTFVDLKYSDTKVAVKDIEGEPKEYYTLDELVHGINTGKSSFITVFWQIENNNGNYIWKYIPNYLFDKQSSNTSDLPALDLGSMLGLKDMVSYFLDNLYEPDKYLHSWVVFDPIIASEKQSGDNTYVETLTNTYYPVIKTDTADYYKAYQSANSNTGYNNFLNLVPKFLRRFLDNTVIIDFDESNSLINGINDKIYTDNLFSINNDHTVSQVSKLSKSGDFVPNADNNNVYPLFDFREVLTFNQTLLNRLDVVSVGEDKKIYHAYIGNNPTTSPDILTIGTSETNNNMKNSQTLPSGNFEVYDRVCVDMPLNETKDAKFENLIIDKDSNGNYFSIVTIDQESEFISHITDTIIPATKYMGELAIGRKVFDASKYVSQNIFEHIVLPPTDNITCEIINNTDDDTTHNEEIIPCGGCSNNSFGYERLSFILYFDKVNDNYAVELKGCEQIISTSNYILGPTVDTNAIDIPLTISLVNDKDKQDAKLTITYSSFVDDQTSEPLLTLTDTLRYSYNPYANFDDAKILDSGSPKKGENYIITTFTIDFDNHKSIYLLGNGNGFSINDYITISCNVEHEVSGNIESLLKNLDSLTETGKSRSLMRSSEEVDIPNKELPIFPYLFKGNENLIDASKLRLPEDIYDFSYYSMFEDCKKLKYGPNLISKRVAAYCYSNMFCNCSELINAPELRSTDIAPFCYQSMFEGCSTITKAPDLHFTEVTSRCCYRMFMDCKSLLEPAIMKTEYFVQNFDSLYNFITNSKIGGNYFYVSDNNGRYIKNTSNIYNKTFMKNVIINPSDINQACFARLYMGCEKFEDLSNLRIYIKQSNITDDRLKSIGVSNLYAVFSDIFRECTSLTKAPSLGKDRLYNADMSRIFMNCTSLETLSLPGFLPNSLIINNTDEEIYSIYESAFEGCTSLKYITGFNSTLMTSYRCYADMFYKCVSLESIPSLTYAIAYKGSYAQMFKGCKSLTKAELKFVEMKTTTPINHFGYSFKYYGSCTNMFEGCENLNDISVEFVNWYNTGDDTNTNLYIDSNSKLLYSQRDKNGNFGNPIYLNSDNQILTTDLLDSTFAENMGTIETPNYMVKIYGNDKEYSIFNIKLVPTFNWLKDVAQSGKFTCYTELPHDAENYLNNPNYIPWGKANIRPDNNDYFYIDIINNDLSGAYYEISLCPTNENVSTEDLPVLDYYAVFNVKDGDKCDKCDYTWSEEQISYWTGSGSGSFTIKIDNTDTDGSSGDTSSGSRYGTWDIVDFLFPENNYACGAITGTWSGSGWDGIGSFTVELYYNDTNNYWVFTNGTWILDETIYSFIGNTSGRASGDWDISYKNKTTEYTSGYMDAAGSWDNDDDTKKGTWSMSGNFKGAYVNLSEGHETEGNAIIVDKWNNLYNPANGANKQLSVSSPLKIGTAKEGNQTIIYTDSEKYPVKYRTRIYFKNDNEKITKSFNAHFDVKIKDVDGNEINNVDSCHYHIGGNIVTLLKRTKYNEYTDKEIPDNAFSQLFNNEILLTLASGLKLTKIVSDSTYYRMFENSTNLIIGPMLPATSLKPYCYQEMFKGCVSLQKLSSTSTNWGLPAITLADYCYNNMFANCTSLDKDLSFLKLSANNLAEGCYKYMFNSCTQLTDTPNISCSSNFAEECFAFMFNNCENLTKIKLNISNLSNIEEFKSTKENYFDNWVYGVKTTRDTEGISFNYNNEEYVNKDAYYNTDYYNDSFIPTKWLPNMPQNYFWIEFDNENEPGTIEIQNNQNNIEYYVDDVNNPLIPDSDGKVTISSWDPYTGNISVNGKHKVYFRYNGEKLPGIFGHFNVSNNYSVGGQLATLYSNDNTIINNNEFVGYGDSLFKELFGHSTNSDNNITSAENLILFNNTQTSCYNHMFADCIYLTKAPVLPAKEIETACYDSMFENCTSLTQIPDLSEVTKIGQESCQFMFKKCTGLTTISNLSNITEIKYKGCNEMFSECTSLNHLSEYSLGNDNTVLSDEACYGMFKKCTGITKAIELPSVNLQPGCYNNMFEGCSSLIYLNVGFTNWNNNIYTNNWVNGVNTEDGDFIGSDSLGVNIESNYNVNRIPTKWWKEPGDIFNLSNLDLSNITEESGDLKVINLDYYKGLPKNYVTDNNLQNKFNTFFEYSFNGIDFIPFDIVNINYFTKTYYQSDGFVSDTTIDYVDQITYIISKDTLIENNEKTQIYIRNSNNKLDIINDYNTINWTKFQMSKNNYYIQFDYFRNKTNFYDVDSNLIYTANGIYPYSYYENDEYKTTGLNSSNYTDNISLKNEYDPYYSYSIGGSTGKPTGSFNSYINIPVTGTPTGRFEVSGDIMSLYSKNMTFYLYNDDEIIHRFPQPSEMFKASNCTDCRNLNITNFNTQLYNILDTKNTHIDTWIFNTKGDVLLNYLPDTSNSHDYLRRVIDYYGMFTNSLIKNIPIFNKVEVNKNKYDIKNSIFNDKCYFRHIYMFAYCYYLINENNNSINLYAEFPDDFFYSFYKCENLVSVNNININISGRNNYLYESMFDSCTSLTSTPKLLSTTLTYACYYNMFSGCTSLETAPSLPAITLARECYSYMFKGCTNLTSVPELKAQTLAYKCCYEMFSGCTSLETAPELPATTLANYCYQYMFKGCNSLKQASELPVKTLADSCYYGMFEGCTSLETAPKLPVKTLADSCYSSMFEGCTNLKQAPVLPAITLANYCYYRMFYGCTSLETAPDLPAKNLTWKCYSNMFSGCIKLNYIVVNFTSWGLSKYNATDSWVENVSSTGTFNCPTQLSEQYDKSRIPVGWTVEQY